MIQSKLLISKRISKSTVKGHWKDTMPNNYLRQIIIIIIIITIVEGILMVSRKYMPEYSKDRWPDFSSLAPSLIWLELPKEAVPHN